MVYRRRATRRVSRRRGRKTLSNYRIATRTGARAQASQIYSLKRWIGRIQRRTRPEIVTIQRTSQPVALSSLSGPILWPIDQSTSLAYAGPQLGSATIDSISGNLTQPVPNNFARLQSFTFYGTIQYNSISETSAPETWRIVILQSKATRQSGFTFSDVFTAPNTRFNEVYGPLQTGLARTAKVLSDKRYILSYQRPSITVKTRLKYLLNYYRDTNDNSNSMSSSDNVPKGAIFVFWAKYVSGSDNANVSTGQFMYKLAYTDA